MMQSPTSKRFCQMGLITGRKCAVFFYKQNKENHPKQEAFSPQGENNPNKFTKKCKYCDAEDARDAKNI